jgi:GrpB-like predicted nucleotidyltransferase (UPF0157 family)
MPLPSHAVRLMAHDPRWLEAAAHEGRRLAAAIGRNLLMVEHFGSTAVPGLAAKPVIDLMPIVADLDELDRTRPRVEALGYEWHGEFGLPGRRFCTCTRADGVRLFHLHFYRQGSPQHRASPRLSGLFARASRCRAGIRAREAARRAASARRFARLQSREGGVGDAGGVPGARLVGGRTRPVIARTPPVS